MKKRLSVIFLFLLMQGIMPLKGLAKSEFKYDPFTDKTKIEKKSYSTDKLPSLWAKTEFQGKKFRQNQKIFLGYLHVNNGTLCKSPRFIADGKLIDSQTESVASFLATLPSAADVVTTSDLFLLKDIRKIATSRNTQFKLCGVIYTMNPEEKAELKRFVRFIESSL